MVTVPLLRHAREVNVIVGVDFGAPQRARDQRKKIIAIAAQATGWHSYRIDATGMNARLPTSEPPGWTAKELADELVVRPARVVGFDFPFCVPWTLLREEKFAKDVGYTYECFNGWRSFNWWIAQRLSLAPIRSTSHRSPRGATAPSARGCGRSARPTSPPVGSRRSRTSSK